MSRLSRTHKIIIAAGLAVILIVILVVSCTPKKPRQESVTRTTSGSFASASCAPPLACGAYYPGYVPAYFIAHPSFSYLSPYGNLYAPTVANGSYRPRTQAPTRTAPRTPMPYPSGYKPVPGDFVPPTAPASKATPAAPAAKSTVPAAAPTQKAPAPPPTKAAPAPAAPKQAPPKAPAPKAPAPKAPAYKAPAVKPVAPKIGK